MNKTVFKVPEGVSKLSQWTEFETILPEGRCILNKKVTGCGATTYFLECQRPVILCSHRLELLRNKSESPRHRGKVHIFGDPFNPRQSYQDKMESLRNYLLIRYDPMFGFKDSCPKILVTTDSIQHVLAVISEYNAFQDFTIISDEMQCIFTDATFKGDSVLKYLKYLEPIKNVVFLSATPYLENYLDNVDEFKDLPYIELEWSPSVLENIRVTGIKVKSLATAATEKIKFFQETGYFEKSIDGEAKQGIFFMNSVTDIARVIRLAGLSPGEVNVVCSRTSNSNLKKLKRVGITEIGTAQLEGEPHKPYTFVTKCAFEGTDFYHPAGYTYIFSDPCISNLSLDISLDIPQILGRQRLDSNPWKSMATLYYKVVPESMEINFENYQRMMEEKSQFTEELTRSILEADPSSTWRRGLIAMHDNSNELQPFKLDYVTLIQDDSGVLVPVFNNLVQMAEIRAWDIRSNIPVSNYQVISEKGGTSDPGLFSETCRFEREFLNLKTFPKKMSAYCAFRETNNPEYLYRSVFIPEKFHYYYDTLGKGKISHCGYQESRVVDLLNSLVTDQDKIRDAVRAKFAGITEISAVDAKIILQEVYREIGHSATAKATDLKKYFQVKEILRDFYRKGGSKSRGFRLTW